MSYPHPFTRVAPITATLGLLLWPALFADATGSAPDWAAAATVQTIHALTLDEDGSPRETKIWLVVLDGSGYIRTSHSTRWGKNVVRQPNFRIRLGETEYPVRATFIEDDALRERIVAAFREKYGTTDWLLQIFRGGRPHLMRLDPPSS